MTNTQSLCKIRLKLKISRVLLVLGFSMIFIGFLCHAHKWDGNSNGQMRDLTGNELTHMLALYHICDNIFLSGIPFVLLSILFGWKEFSSLKDDFIKKSFLLIFAGYALACLVYTYIWSIYYRMI